MYIHACMHACMRVYINTYILTYLLTYVRTCVRTYIHINMCICLRTCTPTYNHRISSYLHRQGLVICIQLASLVSAEIAGQQTCLAVLTSSLAGSKRSMTELHNAVGPTPHPVRSAFRNETGRNCRLFIRCDTTTASVNAMRCLFQKFGSGLIKAARAVASASRIPASKTIWDRQPGKTLRSFRFLASLHEFEVHQGASSSSGRSAAISEKSLACYSIMIKESSISHYSAAANAR